MIMPPLRSLLILAGSATMMAALPSHALTDNERDQMLKDYQSRIQKLEAQLKNTQRSAKKTDQTLKDYTSRLKINGFLTAGVARSTTDQEKGDYEWNYLTKISDEWNWKADSVAGIQFTYAIDPKWDATLQLLSRLEDEFRANADGVINAEWAYLTYRPTDAASVRFGRLRTPLYMFSEYLDVGFAYPWVRPPTETYRIPFTYYDGASIDYVTELGDWTLLTNLAAGRSDPGVVLGIRAEDVGLLNFNFSNGPWTARVGYTQTTVQSDDAKLPTVQTGIDLLYNSGFLADRHQMLGEDNFGQYLSYGGMYDDGTWQIIAEATGLIWDESLILDGWSNYITVGHRFGELTPYFTYSHTYTPGENDEKRRDVIEAAQAYGAANPALAGLMKQLASQMYAFIETQKSYSLGLRWDVSPRVATKFEVSRIGGFDKNGNGTGRYDPIRNGSTVDTEMDYPNEGLSAPQYVTSFVINSVF